MPDNFDDMHVKHVRVYFVHGLQDSVASVIKLSCMDHQPMQLCKIDRYESI